MDFGTHTCLVDFFLDISFDFMPLFQLEETWWSFFKMDSSIASSSCIEPFKLLPKDLGLVEEEGWYN